MWNTNWREQTWNDINQPWDMIIIGGGITGAGILREASRQNLRALLVEQRDFAWGTSSRSSKLVHGGLRYLATGQIGLTLDAVRERQRLMQEAPGLVDPVGFLIAIRKGDKPGRFTYGAGLTLYDLMARNRSHRYYKTNEFKMLAPHMSDDGLQGGFRYIDAQTDDSRLTVRVLREAVADGGTAINYARVADLLKENDQVVGVNLRDETTGETFAVKSKLVINATGAWADQLRQQVGGKRLIRPLRGSHMILPHHRLHVAQAISFLHPVDRRFLFIFPWEGLTIVGTTDLDHSKPLADEARISADEVAYLMAAIEHLFPSRTITLDDIISTMAGVRPVIDTGKAEPSKESREHIVQVEKGLLTVTGGKLTTFRLIALHALKVAHEYLPQLTQGDENTPVLNPLTVNLDDIALDDSIQKRLLGRYANEAPSLIAAAQQDELDLIPGTNSIWAELRWSARSEGIVHLDDLLLRRVRIGLMLPNGGQEFLPRIREICQPELEWSDEKWDSEESAYLDLWRKHYSLPDREAIPDWHEMLQNAEMQKSQKSSGILSLLKYILAPFKVLLTIIRVIIKLVIPKKE